jgi:carboxyl-terminal processing protease
LTREVIRIASVRSRVEGNIAYLRVTTFSEQTASGLETKIREIKQELGDKLVGVVLDLRGNPGGLLDQAIKVSDAFLDQGEIVSTRGRQAGEAQRFNAKSGDLVDGLPLVVLINGGSASASEIVAGALQDHGRAVVLGTQSFGKGSVQTIIPIAGHGAVRLTTSLYYTPSGRSIQAKGISPDIVVEQARLEAVQGRRDPRSEASLRNHIEVGDEESAEAEAAVTDERPFDFQLVRALDLLRGLQLFAKSVN